MKSVVFASTTQKMAQQAELLKDCCAAQKMLDPDDALALMEDIQLA
jgi:hypothetical protein